MTWLFLIPVVVWLAIALLFGFVGWEAITGLKSYLDGMLATEVLEVRDGLWGIWDRIRNFFFASVGWLGGVLATVLTAFVASFGIKYLVLMVLSPVMAYASERTEEILTGNEYPFEWLQFGKDILRGILIALRNGIVEFGLSLVIWLTTLVAPVLAPLSVVLLFLVSSYFYGFSTFDYAHERRRTGVGESIKRIRAERWTVIGNGAMFNILMKVPFLGVVIGPVLASVGASLAFVEKSSGKRNRPSISSVIEFDVDTGIPNGITLWPVDHYRDGTCQMESAASRKNT